MKTLFGNKRVLGFTGTQGGMTPAQQKQFANVIAKFRPDEFHHGDCVGADAQAHAIVRQVAPDCQIVIHPPTISAKRAFCKGDTTLAPLDYLYRNRAIVNASDFLVATPGEDQDQLRSGTWSTVRYAKKIVRQVQLINPRGDLQIS